MNLPPVVHRHWPLASLAAALLLVLAWGMLAPLRGGRAEARNVIRAMRAAWGMRSQPSSSVD